jgi:two-component system, cell cycle response regulator DivK
MKKKILIVEDNKDALEILNLQLTSIGCQVVKACNSKDAIAQAEAELPDLIFMDMGLPGDNGIKITTVLKQNDKTSRIPVVALTAWMSDLWREKAMKAGAVGYILKPAPPLMLKQAIEKFTNESRNPLHDGFVEFISS